MSATDQNFKAIEQGMNKFYKEHQALAEKVVRLENNQIILQQELANLKQLTAHVMGRGMGSTVHKVE